jgi:hypothetical protein
MKLHLVRMSKAQGRARFPGVEGFEARVVRAPEAVGESRMYLVLEGELIIDLPDESYLHLRRNEAAHLQQPHKLVPVDSAVVVVWKP